MTPTKLLSGLLVACLIAACSPKPADEKPQGVLSDAQQRTLDKAKQTEDVLKKANEERLKTIDEVEK